MDFRNRKLLGAALVLHGLGHAGPGMWAAGRGPVEPVALLWWIAATGFILAGFRLLRWPAPRFHPVPLSLLAAAASVSMLMMVWLGVVSVLGLALDVTLPWLVLHGTREAMLFSAEGNHLAGPHRERRRRRPRLHQLATFTSGAFLVYVSATILLRPWHMTWGTTPAERSGVLPGDDLVPDARYVVDHAIVVHAPTAAVWPWVAQLGRDRGGFYSYDRLERLFGVDIHNIDSIVPAWQERAPGDLVPATQPGYLGLFDRPLGWRVLRFEPGRALVLENWGTFVVEPIDSSTTLLHVRMRGAGRPSLAAMPVAPIGLLAFEPAHFIMERGMLRGIRRRAEGIATSERQLQGRDQGEGEGQRE